MKKRNNGLTVSRTQFASLIGVTPDRVSKFIAEGLPVLKSGAGRGNRTVLNLSKALAWYLARHKETPRDRREESQAELNQLKLAQARGELLPRTQVIESGQLYIRAVLGKLRQLPAIAAQEGILSAEQTPKIESLIENAVAEMHQWQSDLDLTAAIKTNEGKAS